MLISRQHRDEIDAAIREGAGAPPEECSAICNLIWGAA
jgi:hypothetical protein